MVVWNTDCGQPQRIAMRSFFPQWKVLLARRRRAQVLAYIIIGKAHQPSPLWIYWECVKESSSWSTKLTHVRVNNKVVQSLAIPEAGSKCHVHVLDLYLSKLPPKAFVQDNFYVQLVTVLPDDPKKPWFSFLLLGKIHLLKSSRKCATKEESLVGRWIIACVLHMPLTCTRQGCLKN